jgi:hypothetical protein
MLEVVEFNIRRRTGIGRYNMRTSMGKGYIKAWQVFLYNFLEQV